MRHSVASSLLSFGGFSPPHQGNPEVHHLQSSVVALDEEIRRLDIPMHHTTSVRRIEGIEQLDHVANREDRRQPLVSLHQRRQRLALEPLHHHVRRAGFLAHAVDRGHRRMRKRSLCLRLLKESPAQLALDLQWLVVEHRRPQHLDRHAPFQRQLHGPVHHPIEPAPTFASMR